MQVPAGYVDLSQKCGMGVHWKIVAIMEAVA